MMSCRIAVAVLLYSVLFAPPASALQGNPYDRALAAFRAGDYSTAGDLFAKTEAASPGSTDALLYEAKCQIHLEGFADAEKALRSYLATRHDSEDALYLLGFVLHRQNKARESLEIYTRAAALKTPTGDDLKIVGLDYVLLNDYPDAIRWLRKAVEFDPKNKDTWYYLGRAYYSESRAPEARNAFRAVLDLDPRDVKAESNLGLIFEAEGRTEDALAAYRKAIAWQKGSTAPSEQPLVNLGSLLTQQGHTQEAIPFLEEAVALAPNNAFCHLKLGTAYLRVQRFRDAQRELEKATELDPDNPAAHYQLGRLYVKIDAMDRAQAEFDRTQKLQSREADKLLAPPRQ